MINGTILSPSPIPDPVSLSGAEAYYLHLLQTYPPCLVITALSFLSHEAVYFGRYLPFLLCDHIPALRRYKIQEATETTGEMMGVCLKRLLFNHVCVQLPMMFAFHPVAEFMGMRIETVPFPSWSDMAIQILFFLVIEDAWQYWAHRGLHKGWFYRNIHKRHHDFTAPFGITAEYAHPAETLILGLGTLAGPWLWVAATADLHVMTVMAWVAVRLLQTVDAHSGYDFPWSLRHIIPFWAGADFHDHHHKVFLGNYGSSFRYWDWICGTDRRYNAYVKAKQDKAAKVNAAIKQE